MDLRARTGLLSVVMRRFGGRLLGVKHCGRRESQRRDDGEASRQTAQGHFAESFSGSVVAELEFSQSEEAVHVQYEVIRFIRVSLRAFSDAVSQWATGVGGQGADLPYGLRNHSRAFPRLYTFLMDDPLDLGQLWRARR